MSFKDGDIYLNLLEDHLQFVGAEQGDADNKWYLSLDYVGPLRHSFG